MVTRTLPGDAHPLAKNGEEDGAPDRMDHRQLTTDNNRLWTFHGILAYKRAMKACGRIAGLALVFLTTFAVAQKSEFDWDWRNQEVIGREDPSVGNTSKLTETERGALVDAIVLRLQKPMGDAGYDDDRIREIATTTRLRFVDVGAGAPLIFTTSIGLEGGCDALGNCPFWVFRHTEDGFLSLLNTIAASFTAKPAEGGLEVVFMHRVSATESGLAVYRFADDKLQGTACYTALWPKRNSDPNSLSDPKLEPCKQSPLLESAHPVKPEASEPAAPAAMEPAQQAPSTAQPEAQPKPETAEPKEQAAPVTELPAAPPPPDSTEPKEQSPATPAPNAEQPQSAPDQTAPQAAPKSDQAQPEQPPASEQPPPDTKQENPKADQPAENVKQDAAKPDQPQPTPDANPPSPDDKQAPPKQDQPRQETAPANPAPGQASPQEPAPSSGSPDSQQAPSSPEQPQTNPNW